MQAIVINEYGDENKLVEKDLNLPPITENQVLVRVKSIGVNPIDWKTRKGLRQKRYPFQFFIVLGQEMSGIVENTGSSVLNFKKGDEVLGYGTPSNRGTYAQYFIIDANQLAHKPKNVSFPEAAGLGLTGTTAWEAIFEAGGLKAGETILILAGSGGVGSMAIQLAKNIGAKVITTTSTRNVDYVKSLGANEVIDYTKQDFAKEVSDVDIVFDTLGGQYQEKAFGVVKPGGRLISIVETIPNAAQYSQKNDVFFNKINSHPERPIIEKLAQYAGDGILKVRIADQKKFNLQNVKDIQKESESGHVDGKLILNIE